MSEDPLDRLDTLLAAGPVDLEALLVRVTAEVEARLGAERATLWLLDAARGELVGRVRPRPEAAEIRVRVGEGIAGRVAASGRVEVALPGDPRVAGRVDLATGFQTRDLVAAPIRDPEGRTAGVLQVLNRREGRFTEEDGARLEALALRVGRLLASTSLAAALAPGRTQPLAFGIDGIVGDSPGMREAIARVLKAAATDATVLVRGETGTGKDLLARAVHANSRRRDGPFVKVDCAALPRDLVENELFGHERGAFTGADRTTDGRVRAADGGTLFLDEVGDLPPPAQGRLLGLLQDRRWTRIGGTRSFEADVRFVSATHRDLEALVAAGRFREDLYYRLRVVEVVAPPLRERGHADLDRLVDHFLWTAGRRHGRPGIRLDPMARAALHAGSWPGNVRELEHCVEAGVVLAEGDAVRVEDLPLGGRAPASRRSGPEAFQTPIRPLADVVSAYARHVLAACDGNRSAAARRLGVARATLLRLLARGDS